MKSVMKHDFSRIPRTDIPHSTFDRSHGLKTAFDSGYLVPIECQEVLPGDIVDFDAKFLARLAPVVTPVMDNVFLETQWFFCPSRIIWTNFVKMMGERVNPQDSIDYLVPQISSGSGFETGSLADYFGIPVNVANLKVNALPFRAYAKIWDEWYRDENLQDSIIQSSSQLGDDTGGIDWNVLRKRGKRHDYFTSGLPWPQKGEGVELPLGGTADIVRLDPDLNDVYFRSDTNAIGSASGPQPVYTASGYAQNSRKWENQFQLNSTSGSGLGTKGKFYWRDDNFKVNLTSTTAATINSLRLAFQLQRMLEMDARSGTRFVEVIRSHFKTVCPDARLQRPEYLGGSSQLISFTPIAQTSGTPEDSGTPQGNLVAQAKCVSGCKFHKSFTEHGYLIGLANVRCDLNYQQGLSRMWSRRGRYDFFWPTLQNLGEQPILNKEIYCQGGNVLDDNGSPVDDGVFAYQERYAEYRYNPSIITGLMRSGITGSLDVWHLAQRFDELPKLDGNFIEDDPPLRRIIALEEYPDIIFDAYLGQKWTRPMATYSIPGLIDHL